MPLYAKILTVIGVVLGFVLAIVIVRISNKRRTAKLKAKLKKIQDEKEELKIEEKLTLASDAPIVKKENVIEESLNEEELKEFATDKNIPVQKQMDNLKIADLTDDNNGFDFTQDDEFDKFLKSFEKKHEKKSTNVKKKVDDDDFEDFLNEHSYTRKVLDNKIMKNLQSLPPDLKKIVISSIFTRPQD